MPPMTYKKLAEHLRNTTGQEISYQRIQQIEESVLKKLRELLKDDPLIIEFLSGTTDVNS